MDGEVAEVKLEEPIAEVPVLGGEVNAETADLIRGFLLNADVSKTTLQEVYNEFNPGGQVTAEFERAFRSVVAPSKVVPQA